MIASRPLPTPTLDHAELARTGDRLADLIRQTAPESAAAAVLRQALREIASLKQSAAGEVIGPFRARAA